MRRPLTRLAFLALPLAALPALTQTRSDTPPASPAAPLVAPSSSPKTRLLKFDADSTYVFHRNGGRVFVLYGHAHLQEGDTDFYADRITFDEDAKTGEAVRDPKLKDRSVGDPKVVDETHTLTADRMVLDFSSPERGKKYVSAIGHARFVAKPDPKDKPGPVAAKTVDKDRKEDLIPRKVKEETVLTCDRMDYYYRTRRGVATGNLRVVQGKRWLTGDQAIYYKQYETIVINGNVKGEDEKGRTFAADNMKIVLTGDTETIQANKFNGTFQLEDEDESPAGQEAPEDKPQIFPGSDEPEPAPIVAPEPPPTEKD